MPKDVEMPAPVKNIGCLDERIIYASEFTFCYMTYYGSMTYLDLYALGWVPWVLVVEKSFIEGIFFNELITKRWQDSKVIIQLIYFKISF